MTTTEAHTTTTSAPQIEARRVVHAYVEIDRQIKALEKQRDEIKPTALVAIQALGGKTEVDFATATYTVPNEIDVDLTQLEAHVSRRKFRELTYRKPVIEKIRAHLTAGTFSAGARQAITHRTGTPRIVITRRAV